MEGQIKATMQDNGGFNTQFGLSVPLIDGVLALRVAGVYDESDLNEVKNDLTGDETSAETKAGRFGLTWLASDTLSFDFTYQYLDNEVNSITVLEGVPTGDPKLDPEGLLRPLGAFDKLGASLGPDITNADFSNSTLVVEWDLPGHLLSSVTGYHETSSYRPFDQALGSANPDNIKLREASDEREDFTQEIRLANTDADFWEYMVGVYYENSDVSFTQDNHLRPGGPFSPASQVLLFPVETDRLGAFTHNKFYLNEQWTLQLGARYQENNVDRELVFVAGADGWPLSDAPGDLIADVLSPENKSYDTDAVTGSASVQYAFAESDTQVYLNYSTGWRPGGVTVTGAQLPEDTLLFGEEESTSFELGFKATLLDGRMRLNGAAFYQDFDDFITRVTALNVRDTNGAIAQAAITENVDAEISGAELELDVLLTERWHLGGGISYTDAKFKSGATLSCNEFDANGSPVIPEGEVAATCDVGGDEMAGLPAWSATVNTDYTIPVGAFEGYTRLLWRYVGSRPNDDIGTLSSYTTADIHFGLRSYQWDVSLFARNVFDEEAVRNGSFATQQVRNTDTGYGARNVLASRVLGLSASYRF